MTLTLDLSLELERRLQYAALRLGLPASQITVQLLDKHLPQKDDCADVASLLQSWIDEEDETEQKETGEYLRRVLDEDRLSERKLFPPELQGVTMLDISRDSSQRINGKISSLKYEIKHSFSRFSV